MDRGYTDAFFGNLSLRLGKSVLITSSGVPLDKITPQAVVWLQSEEGEGGRDSREISGEPSSEAPVHLGIYRLISEVNAVLHAHPFYCVLRSLLDDSDVVTSYTSEGAMFLPEFSFCEGEPGSQELADAVTYSMTKYHTTAVVVRGHGIFCVGRTMDEAYLRCVVAEHECKLWYYRHMVDIHGDS